jgi:hypothetical protein
MTRAGQRMLAVLAVLSAAGLLGCDAQVNAPPPPVDFADAIALRAMPSPVNLDDTPGADGLGVRVELYRDRGKVELLTVKGALEFSMYEGVVRSGTREVKPFRTWRYAGKELEPFLAPGIAGWGYNIPLGWGETGPATSSVTVTARYVPPRGRPMAAEPVTIRIRDR